MITSASAEEAGDRRRAKRIRGWGGGQNVKAGSFSACCVTINSDTLNNSVSDIESAVCQHLPVTLPEGSSSPGGRSHYKKNNQRDLMELISSGLFNVAILPCFHSLTPHTHTHTHIYVYVYMYTYLYLPIYTLDPPPPSLPFVSARDRPSPASPLRTLLPPSHLLAPLFSSGFPYLLLCSHVLSLCMTHSAQ